MNPIVTIACMLLLVVMQPYEAKSQIPVSAIISGIKGINKDKMSYQYTLALVNTKQRKVLDSLTGKMYVVHSDYLDSNKNFITIKDGSYALQINNMEQVAYVKSIGAIESKLKTEVDNSPHVLFDLQKLLQSNVASVKAERLPGDRLSIFVYFKNDQLQSIRALVDKENVLQSLVVTSVAEYGTESGLAKVLSMTNFSDQFQESVVQSTRFLNASSHSYQLKGSYAGYAVKAISFDRK